MLLPVVVSCDKVGTFIMKSVLCNFMHLMICLVYVERSCGSFTEVNQVEPCRRQGSFQSFAWSAQWVPRCTADIWRIGLTSQTIGFLDFLCSNHTKVGVNKKFSSQLSFSSQQFSCLSSTHVITGKNAGIAVTWAWGWWQFCGFYLQGRHVAQIIVKIGHLAYNYIGAVRLTSVRLMAPLW